MSREERSPAPGGLAPSDGTPGVRVARRPVAWEPGLSGTIRGVYTSSEGARYHVRDDEGTVWSVSEASAPSSEGFVRERFLGVAPGERVEVVVRSGELEIIVLAGGSGRRTEEG